MPPRGFPAFGEGRLSHRAVSAAAFTTATSRGSPRRRRRYPTGSRFTAAERGRPTLVLPRDDGAGAIERGALLDDEGEAVVLPRHLVATGKLHAHRPPHRLRHQGGVVGDGVGAVDAVTARPLPEDHVDV